MQVAADPVVDCAVLAQMSLGGRGELWSSWHWSLAIGTRRQRIRPVSGSESRISHPGMLKPGVSVIIALLPAYLRGIFHHWTAPAPVFFGSMFPPALLLVCLLSSIPTMTPPNPQASPVDPSRALQVQLTEKLKSIEQQRERLTEAIREKLVASLVEYKSEYQRLVDEQGRFLDEFSAQIPNAVADSHLPKPCASVPNRFYFGGSGMAIVVYPAEDRYGGPQSPSACPSMKRKQRDATPIQETGPPTSRPTSPSRASSPLTSPPSSSRAPSEAKIPITEPEPAVTPLPNKRVAGPRPPSPDELVPRPSPSLQRKRRKHTQRASNLSVKLAHPAATTSEKDKSEPAPVSMPTPTPKARTTPAVRRNSTQTQIFRCFECAKRRQICSKEMPCSRCVQKGLAEKCAYPQKEVDTGT